MGILEIIIIGIGLSMDACCVSISNGMCTNPLKARHALADALFFGSFQGIMPLIGFFAGSLFVGILSKYSFWIVSAIFLILGGKMIYDAATEEDKVECKKMTFRLLLIQAIATSIDALAVGVSFSAMQVNIFMAVCLIAATTFVISFASVYVGHKIGTLLNKKAGIFGGILLLGIAAKVLLDGLLAA
ncbi:putative sporulation protein YtaF [uncultured Ruminococcus sp.]|nr:manganese efflux pump MntP family protein [Massiliimalia timonensis]SCH02637.1 putative sporulation protein YtaF [uncultured Clostridium sp.]SCH98536.1 putative sporulation protein YtaF [uncultured Ruminococcus sp.]